MCDRCLVASDRGYFVVMNIGRSLRRAIRPLWIAGLGAAAWSNRAKVQEALGHKLSPTLQPAAGDKVTVRTTVATWTKPLRSRYGSPAAQSNHDSSSDALPSDMAAPFVEPTASVPSMLTDSSSLSGEV